MRAQVVQNVWKGDIRRRVRARELLCLVEFIRNYAKTTHRNFVMEHLTPWLRRSERVLAHVKDNCPKCCLSAECEPEWRVLKNKRSPIDEQYPLLIEEISDSESDTDGTTDWEEGSTNDDVSDVEVEAAIVNELRAVELDRECTLLNEESGSNCER